MSDEQKESSLGSTYKYLGGFEHYHPDPNIICSLYGRSSSILPLAVFRWRLDWRQTKPSGLSNSD